MTPTLLDKVKEHSLALRLFLLFDFENKTARYKLPDGNPKPFTIDGGMALSAYTVEKRFVDGLEASREQVVRNLAARIDEKLLTYKPGSIDWVKHAPLYRQTHFLCVPRPVALDLMATPEFIMLSYSSLIQQATRPAPLGFWHGYPVYEVDHGEAGVFEKEKSAIVNPVVDVSSIFVPATNEYRVTFSFVAQVYIHEVTP